MCLSSASSLRGPGQLPVLLGEEVGDLQVAILADPSGPVLRAQIPAGLVGHGAVAILADPGGPVLPRNSSRVSSPR